MSHFMERLARLLGRFPITASVIAVVLTIISIRFALDLQIKSSLVDLLPQDAPHVRNLHEISERAGGVGYLIVVVEGQQPAVLKQFAEDLFSKIKDNPQIKFIYYKNNLDFIHKHALLFLTEKDLVKIEQFLQEKVQAEGARLNPFYVDLLSEVETKPKPSLEQFQDVIEKYAFLNREYLTNSRETFLVLLIKPHEVAANIKTTAQLVDSVQLAIDRLGPVKYDPQMQVHLTGRYANQLRENQTIRKDLYSTTSISVILIVILLSTMLKRRRTVFVIGIPLIMGMAWTFGLSHLFIGELNLITSFLIAILTGLGINFGVHFFKRYLEFREKYPPKEAVIRMYGSSVGISSITASLTTAAAFFSLMLTQFKGFNQFGIIAGIGSILTLVAYFVTFPPIVILYERFYPIKSAKTTMLPRLEFIEKLLQRASALTITFYAFVIIVLILIGFMTQLHFEYNFERLGTATAEDYRLKEEINKLFDTSLSPTIVMANSESESRQIVQIVSAHIKQGSKTITTVRDINSMVPGNQLEKIAIIQRIKAITENKIFSFLTGKEQDIFNKFKPFFDVEPLTVDQLPPYLTVNFLGDPASAERFVLIYPSIDQSDGKQVIQYAAELDRIQVNGKPLRTSSESLILADILELITRDGAIAMTMTIISILLLLWIHFKRPVVIGLTMLPITLGMFCLLGLMGLIGLKLNFINLIALPIIVGTGVDNSVHFYHRYKEDHTLWFAFYHTGMAMLLSTLTTVIGFGSLFFAQHRGLRTLGMVAVMGLLLNLLITFIILPLLIKINKQHTFRILRFSWLNRALNNSDSEPKSE
ncbi:MMPL family transporter [candidate division KSB1 bacterium]|nr:MMPL family transporter [candidate division KSB1 bacterium]